MSYLGSLWDSLLSSGSVRGLVLAGAALLSARAIATASASKGYRKKLPSKRRVKKVAAAAASSSSSSSAAAEADEEDLLSSLALDKAEFLALLGSFIAHTEKLQNNPSKVSGSSQSVRCDSLQQSIDSIHRLLLLFSCRPTARTRRPPPIVVWSLRKI
jgi:hypothetical protein